MTRCVAFLRAINAGRARAVKMDVLREAFESLALSSVETFLGSGNVIFETKVAHVKALESKIERRLCQRLGWSVPAFIRTFADLKNIAALAPFDGSQIRGGSINVIFLPRALDDRSRIKLAMLSSETDRFHVHGHEIFWWRRKKPGTSIFATVPLEKAIRARFTVRSMNTIRRLVAKWQ